MDTDKSKKEGNTNPENKQPEEKTIPKLIEQAGKSDEMQAQKNSQSMSESDIKSKDIKKESEVEEQKSIESSVQYKPQPGNVFALMEQNKQNLKNEDSAKASNIEINEASDLSKHENKPSEGIKGNKEDSVPSQPSANIPPPKEPEEKKKKVSNDVPINQEDYEDAKGEIIEPDKGKTIYCVFLNQKDETNAILMQYWEGDEQVDKKKAFQTFKEIMRVPKHLKSGYYYTDYIPVYSLTFERPEIYFRPKLVNKGWQEREYYESEKVVRLLSQEPHQFQFDLAFCKNDMFWSFKEPPGLSITDPLIQLGLFSSYIFSSPGLVKKLLLPFYDQYTKHFSPRELGDSKMAKELFMYFERILETSQNNWNSSLFLRAITQIFGLIPPSVDLSYVEPGQLKMMKRFIEMISKGEGLVKIKTTNLGKKELMGIPVICYLIQDLKIGNPLEFLISLSESIDISECFLTLMKFLSKSGKRLPEATYKIFCEFIKNWTKTNQKEIKMTIITLSPTIKAFLNELNDLASVSETGDQFTAIVTSYFEDLTLSLDIISEVLLFVKTCNQKARNAIVLSRTPDLLSKCIFDQWRSTVSKTLIAILYDPDYISLLNDPNGKKRWDYIQTLIFPKYQRDNTSALKELIPYLKKEEAMQLIKEGTKRQVAYTTHEYYIVRYIDSICDLVPEPDTQGILKESIEDLFNQLDEKIFWRKEDYFLGLPKEFTKLTSKRPLPIIMDWLKKFVSQEKYKAKGGEQTESNPLQKLLFINRTEPNNQFLSDLLNFTIAFASSGKPASEDVIEHLIKSPQKNHLWYFVLDKALDSKTAVSLLESFTPVWMAIVDRTMLCEHINLMLQTTSEGKETFEFYMKKVVEVNKIVLPENTSVHSIITDFLKTYQQILESESLLRCFFTKNCSSLPNFQQFYDGFNNALKNRDSLALKDVKIPEVYLKYLDVAKKIANVSNSGLFMLIIGEAKNENKAATVDDIERSCIDAYNKLKSELEYILNDPATFPMMRISEIAQWIVKVDEEIQIYKNLYTEEENQKNPDRFDLLVDTLYYFKSRSNYQDFCQSIISLLGSLRIDDRQVKRVCEKTGRSTGPEQILNMTVINFLNIYREVDRFALKRAKNVKEDEKTKEKRERFFAIATAINNAADLINFSSQLKEEDLNNLKQCVAEYPDTFVAKGTVLDFVIWWYFLKNIRDNSQSYIKLYETIIQTSSLHEYNDIVGIIKTCTEQLYGIINLYRELTQNQEAKKKRVIDICTQSTFDVEFIKKRKVWEIRVEYELESKQQKLRQIIHQNEILDLKDRVLLIINTEEEQMKKTAERMGVNYKADIQTSTESMQQYVRIVDELANLSESLRELYLKGYPNLKEYKNLLFVCTNGMLNGITMEEFHKKYQIDAVLNSWLNCMEKLYVSNPWITFLHGRQPWILEKYFLKKQKKHRNQAYALLKYMNKKLDEHKMKKYELKETPEERLKQLGDYLDSLDFISDPLPSIYHMKSSDSAQSYDILYTENRKLLSGICTLYKATHSPRPSPSQLLFCHRATTKEEIACYIYRVFLDPDKKLYTIIYPELLSLYCFREMYRLITDLKMHQFSDSGFSLAFLVNDDEHQTAKEVKNELCNFSIQGSSIVNDDIIETEIKESDQKRTTIFLSHIAGMGKTTKAIEQATKEKHTVVFFPISGEISFNEITMRLSNIDLHKKVLLVQLDNISSKNKLITLLYQLIVLKCLFYKQRIIYVDCRIYIECSASVPIECIEPYKQLCFPPITEFNVLDYNLNLDDLFCCYYLDCYSKGLLENPDTELIQQFDTARYISLPHENCRSLIETFIVKDRKQINSFVSLVTAMKLLKYSLHSLSLGGFEAIIVSYRQEGQLTEMLSKLKARVFESILLTTEEFTIKIVENLKELQLLTHMALSKGDATVCEQLKVLSDKERIIGWEKINHFLLLFSKEGSWMPLYKNPESIPGNIKEFLFFVTELDRLAGKPDASFDPIINSIKSGNYALPDLSTFSEMELFNMLGRLRTNAEREFTGSNYVVTLDNFLKMGLIYMRAEAGIPVIIMGETGCGKTALVRFLARKVLSEEFQVLNMHAGITDANIIEFMELPIQQALVDDTRKVWIFFDEFNTSSSLGLIKEIICDRRMLGESIPPNIVFIAACNPYKLRTKDALSDVNLGIKKNLLQDQIEQSRLLHRVYPVPDTMLEYVWNFGSLTPEDEARYITSILRNVNESMRQIFVNCIIASHKYYKAKEGVSSVSLRDVRRFTIFYEWFEKDISIKQSIPPPADYEKVPNAKVDPLFRCGLLSLLFCYYLRIQKPAEREEYLNAMLPILRHPRGTKTVKEIEDILFAEQMYILMRMKIPDDIAQNQALRENVYTMLICIMNRVALFIVGKPGCSKSLSIQLLVSNIRGRDSADPYFKKLNELVMVYFQGSNSCTSEGILKVFERAEKVLSISKDRNFLPVFVFDEIGLAELSPYNPLKVLHSKLEIDNDEEFKREDKTAFIGISNWRLDASKMNRALYLARPDPTVEDLVFTGQQICKSITGAEEKFAEYIDPLSKAYYRFREGDNKKEAKDSENYYGLRDFYSMIKHAARSIKTEETKTEEDMLRIMKKAIERNFGCLKSSLGGGKEMIRLYEEISNKKEAIEKLRITEVLELIKENLADENARYLMLIGKGDIPAYILDHCLHGEEKSRRIIVGSQFSEDISQEKYAFKSLSDIIMLMERDTTVVLRGMDEIYSSLYDLFNQNFSRIGDKRYCRVAIGAEYNPKCPVHKNFHCIIFMEEANIQNVDPPFLNRFEKYNISFDDVMTQTEKGVYQMIKTWIEELVQLKDEKKVVQLPRYQIFMNYSEDFLKILAMNKVQEAEKAELKGSAKKNESEIAEICELELIKLAALDLLILLHASKIATRERERIQQIYNDTHKLNFKNIIEKAMNGKSPKTLIFTYSPLIEQFTKLPEFMQKLVSSYRSEEELKRDLSNYYRNPNLHMLILDFDLPADSEHILFVKAALENVQQDFYSENRENAQVMKNVCFIFHMKRNQRYENEEPRLVIFEGWDALMIDDILIDTITTFDEGFLRKTTKELILEEKFITLNDGICEVLEKSFLNLKYEISPEVSKEEINNRRIQCLVKIPHKKNLLTAFAQKIIKNIEERGAEEDWKIEMYNNAAVVASSETTLGAIKNYLLQVIEKSLTHVLYTVEGQMALMSFFTEKAEDQKIIEPMWLAYFQKIEVKSHLDLVQLLEATTIKYYMHLGFPFSYSEFQIYKKCYESAINTGIAQSSYFDMMERFQECVNKETRLSIEDFKVIREVPIVKFLYWSDMVSLYLFSIHVELKWLRRLQIFLDKLLPDTQGQANLFYLFSTEKSFQSFFGLLTLLESQLNQNTTKAFTDLKINLKHGVPKSDSVVNQYLIQLLNNICLSYVLDPKLVAKYDFVVYRRFLENFTVLLREFEKITASKIPLVKVLEFVSNYTSLLQYGKGDQRENLAKLVSNFANKDKPEAFFENVELFKTIRTTFLNMLKTIDNEGHRDQICKFLSEYCLEMTKISAEFMKDYIHACSTTGMWKYIKDIFDLLKGDFETLLNNFIKLDTNHIDVLNHLENMKAIESFFKGTDINNNCFSILATDTFANLFENKFYDQEMKKQKIPLLECEKVFIHSKYQLFTIAYAFLEEQMKTPFNKIYKLIALGFLRKYIDAYTDVLVAENDKDLEGIDLILQTDMKISRTLSLYASKKLLSYFKGSIVDLGKFLKSHVENKTWMKPFIIPQKLGQSTLADKIPVFPEIEKPVQLFAVDLGYQIKAKFANSEDFLPKMKNFLKSSNDAVIVLLGFLHTVYVTHYDDPSIGAEVASWLSKQPLNDIDPIYITLLTCFANNFPKKSLLHIGKDVTILENTKAIILATMIILCISFKHIPNQISSLFYDKTGCNNLKTTFSQNHILSAPFPEYLTRLKTDYLEEAKMGYTLYQCSDTCEYVYFVADCGRPMVSYPCPFCHSPIGGASERSVERPGHRKLTKNYDDTHDFSFKEQNPPDNKRIIEAKIKTMEDKIEFGINFSIMNSSVKTETARGMEALTFRILNLMVSSHIYYFHETHKINDSVYPTFGLKKKEDLHTLIENSLTAIYDILQDSQTEQIIYSILSKLPRVLRGNAALPRTLRIRNDFETVVDQQIVKNVLKNVTEAKIEYKRQLEDIMKHVKEATSTEEGYLTERERNLEKYPYLQFFRMIKTTNLDFFEAAYRRSPHLVTNPLIDYYLKQKDEMEHLKGLYPITDFTNALLDICSHQYGRNEALHTDVKTVLNENPELNEKFNQFILAWNAYIKNLSIIDVRCKHFVPPELNDSQNLHGFLLDDKEESNGFAIYGAIFHLGNYQNKVLQDVYGKKGNLQGLKELMNHGVPVQALEKDAIISMNFNLENYVSGVADPNYGYGSEVFYDFDEIEKAIFAQIVGKKFADIEKIRTMAFQGEAFNNESSIISEIRKKIPQKPLSNDITNILKSFFKNQEEKQKVSYNNYLRLLYGSLETILLFVKNANAAPDTTLEAFCQKMNSSKLANDLRHKTCLSSVKLENIIDFYEIVEKKYFPYFRQFISINYKSVANKAAVEEGMFKFYDLIEKANTEKQYPKKKTLLNVLTKLIMRRFTVHIRPDCSIKLYLGIEEFWPFTVTENQITAISEDWPDVVTLGDTFVMYDWLHQRLLEKSSKLADSKLGASKINTSPQSASSTSPSRQLEDTKAKAKHGKRGNPEFDE